MERPILDRLLAGETQALARAISRVENGAPDAAGILKSIYPRTGRTYVIGVTGPPGAGKSCLVNRLVSVYREQGEKVGIIAVDPSSAFSGGAILGDRIRMQGHSEDQGVFIRSMANRGHPGGLSKATHDAVDLLDAAGFGCVLLETVGVGQDEIEVVEGADTVCVVLVPGLGDDIQSIKAGIMEIAHVFVINKCDRGEADRVQGEVEQMLSLGEWKDRWRPTIARTVATTGAGVEDLVARIAEHREAILHGPEAAQRRRDLSRTRFLDLLRERLLDNLRRDVGESTLEDTIREIAERQVDPYTAADRVLSSARGDGT